MSGASPTFRFRGFGNRWGWRAELLRDLDRLQTIERVKHGKTMMLRTPVTGSVGPLFKAVGVALPPNVRDTA